MQVEDRVSQGPHRLARRRGGAAHVNRRRGRIDAQLARQRVEHQAEAGQLLDGAVVKVLRHPPPLLLLGQHQRRRERPPLALLAPKVGQQPRVGQRHRGLVGQPAEALDVVPVEGVAGCPRQRDRADGQVAPVGRRHGHGHLAHPRRGPPSRGGDGQPLGGREQIAAGAVVRRRHDAVLPVAQHQHGGVGADQPPRLGHDRAVGVLLVQRAGHPPCHLGQGGELTHLPVQLARPILHTGEKLIRPQL